MSFKASLEIDGNSYKIINCNFNFTQPMGNNLKPNGNPLGGLLNVTLNMGRNLELAHWMFSPTQTKDGTVIFYKHDAMSKELAIAFKNAYCTNITGNFDDSNNQPLLMTVSIVAEEINLNGDATLKNNWGQVNS